MLTRLMFASALSLAVGIATPADAQQATGTAPMGTATATPPITTGTATATLNADKPGPRLNRNVFGQFAEHLGHGIYGGIWVGKNSKIANDQGYRTDVLDALRAIKVPLVRWPGGCFADEYHWRDGIGTPKSRPTKVNTNWGGVNEDNSFGTHEFMGFAQRLGAQAYIAANVGSAPPSETAQWVEYMTAPANSTVLAKERAKNGHAAPWKIDYLGIGNELWGCGGNMRAEYAADVTNRYAQFAKSANGPMLKIASGPSDSNYEWTETLMKASAKYIDGLALHYYTIPTGDWKVKGAALGFPEHEWAQTMQRTLMMEEFVTKHSAIMDKYDPDKKVALVVDEWGTWYDVMPGTNPGFLMQQNSLRDAIVAGLNLNIFTHHADRVRMAAIAQMVNVLQAMLLTDGPKMVRTPTYWVFDLYKPWQDATVLPITLRSPWYHMEEVAIPAVSASAVRDTAGRVHVALVNLDPNRAIPLSMAIAGVQPTAITGRIITGAAMDAHNSFDDPDQVKPVAFDGARVSGSTLEVTVPAKSVIVLDL